jgi:hypothetical protein
LASSAAAGFVVRLAVISVVIRNLPAFVID